MQKCLLSVEECLLYGVFGVKDYGAAVKITFLPI